MLDLGARLDLYLRLFARRRDLHVWCHERGAPSRLPALPAGEAAALLGGATRRFAWSFSPPYGDQPQGDGGHLFLAADHEDDWQDPAGRWLDGVASSLLIDRMVDEGLGLLVVDEGEDAGIAAARPALFDANDDRLIRFESLEAYLTLGARRGFAWYWQNDDNFEWPDLLERLHQGSLAADAGEEALRAGLQAQGASAEEADVLIAWLGDDARLLVPVA